MKNSPNIIPSTYDISYAFYDLSVKTGEALDERNPESLIIGTHPHIPLVGEGYLARSKFPHAARTRIVDFPSTVLEKLELLLAENRSRYACVIAAFEAHHFHGDALKQLVEMLSELSHGVVLVSDYAYQGCALDDLRDISQSRNEQTQQKIYGGYESWVKDHAVFSNEGFAHTMSQADWTSLQNFSFPKRRVGMIASPTLAEHELEKIWGDVVGIRSKIGKNLIENASI